MKTYVLIVSRKYPKGHKKEGQETYFEDKILFALGCPSCETQQDLTGKNISECNGCPIHATISPKLHTCRRNYEYWAKIIKEIQDGKAILSLRYWSEIPYKSKQIKFAQLDKDSGISVQKLKFENPRIHAFYIDELPRVDISTLAKNDGLSFDDFKDWFKNYDLSKPMAIIHFTNFRY